MTAFITQNFVPLLFGLVHLPSWDEMVELTSGRFSMWLEKIDILANSSLLPDAYVESCQSNYPQHQKDQVKLTFCVHAPHDRQFDNKHCHSH